MSGEVGWGIDLGALPQTPGSPALGSSQIKNLKPVEGWGVLIVPSAIDPGKPSRPAPPAQARLCRQGNQRARKATGNMYTRSRACPSVTGLLPLRGGSIADGKIRAVADAGILEVKLTQKGVCSCR